MSITMSKIGSLGRMANAMFQISAVVGQARKCNTDWFMPEWKYTPYFEGDFPTQLNNPSLPKYTEKSFHYTEIPFMEIVDLEGYWQSIKYWQHCEDEIRSMFTFKQEIIERATSFIQKHSNGKIPVFVHQRYGDYITMKHYYCNLTPEWYMEAMNMFDPTTHHFFVVSDDINLARQNTIQTVSITFCGFDEITDLAILSLCSGGVMANSSFSWFGAFLGKQDKKIIAPACWFTELAAHNTSDLYLDTWTIL